MRKSFRIKLDPEIDKSNINPILKMSSQADWKLTEMLTRRRQATLGSIQEMKNYPIGHLIIEWMDQTQGVILSMTEST